MSVGTCAQVDSHGCQRRRLVGPDLNSSPPPRLHLCRLVLHRQPGDAAAFTVTRHWCDGSGSGEIVGVDSRLVPAVAGGDWLDGQDVTSRLWAATVYVGFEYDVTAPRATRTHVHAGGRLEFEQRSTMLSSQQRFSATETFELNATSTGELAMRVRSAAPALRGGAHGLSVAALRSLRGCSLRSFFVPSRERSVQPDHNDLVRHVAPDTRARRTFALHWRCAAFALHWRCAESLAFPAAGGSSISQS